MAILADLVLVRWRGIEYSLFCLKIVGAGKGCLEIRT